MLMRDDDFHRTFNKQFNQTRRLAVGGFLVTGVLGIGTVVALVYVAHHFISKIW